MFDKYCIRRITKTLFMVELDLHMLTDLDTFHHSRIVFLKTHIKCNFERGLFGGSHQRFLKALDKLE